MINRLWKPYYRKLILHNEIQVLYRQCKYTTHTVCMKISHMYLWGRALFLSFSQLFHKFISHLYRSSPLHTPNLLDIHNVYEHVHLYVYIYVCTYACIQVYMYQKLDYIMKLCSWWHFLSILQLCNITIDEGFCREGVTSWKSAIYILIYRHDHKGTKYPSGSACKSDTAQLWGDTTELLPTSECFMT